MIRLDEFIHLYRLKESKEYGYYKLVPGSGRRGSSGIFLCLSGTGSSGTFLYLEMDERFFLMTFGVKFLGCFVDGGPRG